MARQIVDRGFVNNTPHWLHFTGTTVGSDEPVAGAKLMGWNVPTVGADPMVGRAMDDAAGVGDDFNNWAIVDGSGSNDSAPLGSPGSVVVAESEGERSGRSVQVGNCNVSIISNDTRIPAQTIGGAPSYASRNTSAEHAPAVAVHLPPAGGARVRTKSNPEVYGAVFAGVRLKVALHVRAPPAGNLVRVADHHNT